MFVSQCFNSKLFVSTLLSPTLENYFCIIRHQCSACMQANNAAVTEDVLLTFGCFWRSSWYLPWCFEIVTSYFGIACFKMFSFQEWTLYELKHCGLKAKRASVSKCLYIWFLSQRLTAFALRVLGQISKYVDQNQNSICNSLLWLLEKCQLENGSFKENSDYQPVKLQVRKPNAQMNNSLI